MPAGGSRQSAPAESQANVLEARSGILLCAAAGLANAKVAIPSAATMLLERSVLRMPVNGDIIPSISSSYANVRRRGGLYVTRGGPIRNRVSSRAASETDCVR